MTNTKNMTIRVNGAAIYGKWFPQDAVSWFGKGTVEVQTSRGKMVAVFW